MKHDIVVITFPPVPTKKPFPKRARTLSNKIRLSNPWLLGKELADLIDLNWDLVKQANTLDADWFHVFTAKHHLASSHVIDTIERTYL